jgi:iron complex transport system substrate-binding protein
MHVKRIPRRLVLSTIALLALAACGTDDDTANDASNDTASVSSAADTTATSAAPATGTGQAPDTAPAGTSSDTSTAGTSAGTSASPNDTAAGDDTGSPDAPERIVSLSPSATETLFAIGAGDDVVAVDELSNFPEEAAAVMTDLSGYTPNVEAIAAYDPDLVIHDGTQDLSGLETLGIEQLASTAPEAFDDVYARIDEIGEVTGHTAEAEALVAEMKDDVEAAVDSVEVLFEAPPRIYHELDDTLFSINSNTFIGQVYTLLGLQNIADTAEGGSDYPQLSAEFVISQNPDVIFLADAKCCGQSAETVAARPGWDAITAVDTGNVIPVDEDLASRWGPRIVQYVEFVADAVNDLGAPSGG